LLHCVPPIHASTALGAFRSGCRCISRAAAAEVGSRRLRDEGGRQLVDSARCAVQFRTVSIETAQAKRRHVRCDRPTPAVAPDAARRGRHLRLVWNGGGLLVTTAVLWHPACVGAGRCGRRG
jgi:hypothetical protein